ncbi:cobalt transporter CbiM [Aetokthonos hydrillicola Thurmond2011]|jgi:cobalt/nickel transport system permease protein|uniref:Cobalt transporter CbiM n=1 Tax=Aetokthonos hydrillicola Thurmond2011 TaxID=2712845 RepID=A0AAP5I821_9CYAN|nr:cobalt transporter CbiM [Aetokthonos hydrillicola]MBO3458601.1 cobalt transporter CbiM [Aetokthonos hydrillicola CCALA 1050]MBW4585044.1 cobalt transporter CbiM [Aetokthonos hydrillicola CCALA 1050]MDR9894195.1 cobalt transporter CbiM [Aetokthonos hydrillicola Thurmond2011]
MGTIAFSNWQIWLIQPHLAMHVPDGFLNLPVLLVTWVIAIGLIAIALKQAQLEYKERTVPLMGVCAAFIFAAQMVNFPIPGGTSGHLLGGTLAASLLGPWAGALVMASVFIVQGAVFQDGGLTALGANIFNMGLIGTFGGYYIYRTIRFAIGRDKLNGMVVGTAIAAWASVVVASIICAFELALSGTVPLPVALTTMASWHVVIGIGEALISVIVVSFVWRTRPDLLYDPPRKVRSSASRPLSPR